MNFRQQYIMKTFIYLTITVILLSNNSLLAGDAKKTNEYVKVEITLKQKEFKAGTTGEILVNFKPKDEIHINLDPPISVSFDSGTAISTTGKPVTTKGVKSEYLDVSKPVSQKFTLSKRMKSGTHALKGTLTYFYCSGNDGWCSRFKEPFEFTIKVK